MRVFLANRELAVRSALEIALDREFGAVVVGEASGTQGLVEWVRAADPDLVLVDWELPTVPVAYLLPALRSTTNGGGGQRPFIVVLSVQPDVEDAALAAGADAFVSKTDPPARLLAALRRLLPGRTRPAPGGPMLQAR
jgi:DNA-binding NarL/FixJ family response regulator